MSDVLTFNTRLVLLQIIFEEDTDIDSIEKQLSDADFQQFSEFQEELANQDLLALLNENGE